MAVVVGEVTTEPLGHQEVAAQNQKQAVVAKAVASSRLNMTLSESWRCR